MTVFRNITNRTLHEFCQNLSVCETTDRPVKRSKTIHIVHNSQKPQIERQSDNYCQLLVMGKKQLPQKSVKKQHSIQSEPTSDESPKKASVRYTNLVKKKSGSYGAVFSGTHVPLEIKQLLIE